MQEEIFCPFIIGAGNRGSGLRRPRRPGVDFFDLDHLSKLTASTALVLIFPEERLTYPLYWSLGLGKERRALLDSRILYLWGHRGRVFGNFREMDELTESVETGLEDGFSQTEPRPQKKLYLSSLIQDQFQRDQ